MTRFLFLLPLFLLSCAGGKTVRVDAPTVIRSELYFGLSRRAGAKVEPAAWARFLDTAITPRFPDGLTVIDAAGQYRGSDGVLVREQSKVVVIVHPASAVADSSLARICRSYALSFDQESVMKISTPCSQEFISR